MHRTSTPSSVLTLREQAAVRASANSSLHTSMQSPSPQNYDQARDSEQALFANPHRLDDVLQTPSPYHQHRRQEQIYEDTSHPLSTSFMKPNETPESIVHSARKEWKRHGSGITQDLEEKRYTAAITNSGATTTHSTLSVRVLSGETRKDISGKKYTTYILKVHHANGTVLELEHRYSEFAKLKDLLSAHSIQMNCAFPGKHLAGRLGHWTPSLKWAPEKHDDLVQYRKVQLDVWLVHVVEQYNLGLLPHTVHQAVFDFLTHSDRPPCEQENLLKPETAESWTRWSNPLSFTMGSSIRQATVTMEHMFPEQENNGDANSATGTSNSTSTWSDSDKTIPLDLLQHAKGLCFLTVLKGGLVVSGRVGTGLLVARINDHQWSAPCALGTLGMGWGMLAGGDITHYLVVLTKTEAVDALLSGTVQLGAELGVAVGPVGRGATSQVAAGDWSIHPAYSYAHSQGFFVGISLEGSVLTTRSDVNAKFYGQHYKPSLILDLPPPKAADPLYKAIRKALALQIPEDAFRPSQLFQEKTYTRPAHYTKLNGQIQSPSSDGVHVDEIGRVSMSHENVYTSS